MRPKSQNIFTGMYSLDLLNKLMTKLISMVKLYDIFYIRNFYSDHAIFSFLIVDNIAFMKKYLKLPHET